MDIPPPAATVDQVEDAVPDETGAYFWFFRSVLEKLFTEAMEERLHWQTVLKHNQYALLYVGIAEGQTLRERIVEKHLRPNSHASTLRFSIGSLLAHKQELPRVEGLLSGKFALAENSGIENMISKFLREHAMVSWIQAKEPAAIEGKLLGRCKDLSFPLNIKNNGTHPFCRTLKA